MMTMTDAWWQSQGERVCTEVWEDGEEHDVPQRDMTVVEVAFRLVRWEDAAEAPEDLAFTDEALAAFNLGFWREFREREDRRSEGAYERQCAAFYGGSAPQTMSERLAEARKQK